MKTLSMLSRLSTVVAALMLFVLVSCQKESSLSAGNETVTEEEATTLSDESVQAEAGFDDVEDVSMLAAEEEGETSMYGRGEEASTGRLFPFAELRLRLGPCAEITVTPNDSTYPKTVTIDFGPVGCLCADGKYRRGAIIIHLTAPIRRPGAVMTIALDSFYLNRAKIEGTKILSNLSENGNIKFTVQVVGGKVTHPNGRGYQYNSMKYVRQVEGGNTRPVRDDVFKIETRSSTQFNNGVTVNLNTETPLVKKTVCHWISDGKLKIRINSRVLFLDFGAPNNGDCDNKALLTWNNGANSRMITLP
ncbi:MAG: hypothetical protein IAE96_09130 [Chitinophagaceae bacterium]|nr:hypothetical protein [Chitinophagaceae bacterium]